MTLAREGTTVDKVSIHRFILTWSRKPVGRFETSRTGDSGITARSSFLLDGNLRAARVLTIIGPRRIVDPLEKTGSLPIFSVSGPLRGILSDRLARLFVSLDFVDPWLPRG